MTNTQQKLHSPMAEKRPRIFRNHDDECVYLEAEGKKFPAAYGYS